MLACFSGRLKRLAAQFTPYSWTDFDWRPASSLKRWMAMLAVIAIVSQPVLTRQWRAPPVWLPSQRSSHSWHKSTSVAEALIRTTLWSLPVEILAHFLCFQASMHLHLRSPWRPFRKEGFWCPQGLVTKLDLAGISVDSTAFCTLSVVGSDVQLSNVLSKSSFLCGIHQAC